MNYVITGVKSRRKKYINMNSQIGDSKEIANVNQRMLTIVQYQQLAKRVIGKWAPEYAKASMLNSEDAIDFVAHLIMIGDWNYEETKSNIKTHRGNCGKMAIYNYLRHLTKQKKKAANNFLTDNDGNNIYDLIPDENMPEPYMKIESIEKSQEDNQKLNIVMSALNDTQRSCMVMHHVDGMNLTDIGRKLNISREGVRRALNKGMDTTRSLLGVRNKG